MDADQWSCMAETFSVLGTWQNLVTLQDQHLHKKEDYVDMRYGSDSGG